MHVLTLALGVRHTAALRALLRELRAGAAPRVPGLAARHWSLTARGARGRYLFDDERSAERFATAVRALAGEPVGALSPDPALDRLLACPGAGGPHVGPAELVQGDAIERPVFVLAAPRAGSTMLYDLLCRSRDLWSSGAESHGPIEGIPALGLAARGYASHRLTELDATPVTVEALRCGLLAELRDGEGRRWPELPVDRRPLRVRMVEKTPENALRVSFLRAAFPDARFVWLTREGPPNVSSIVEAWGNEGFVTVPELPGWPGGQWHLVLPPGWRELAGRGTAAVAAFQWAAANRAILDALAAAPDGSWCAVAYEELIARPAEATRRLCAFLEVPFDARLRAATQRPLPVAATATSHPSPAKWRFNRAFDSSVLDECDGLAARMRAAAARAAPERVRPRDTVRFHCFLDELDGLAANGAGPHHRASVDDELVVDPSLQVQLGITIPLPLVKRTRFRGRFLSNHALAWVEDPASASVRPFWIPDADIWHVARLVPGCAPDPDVIEPLRRQLVRAGVLSTALARERRRVYGEQRAALAREHFRDHRYCMMSGLLHPGHVGALRRYYRSLIASGRWKLGDAQVAGRYGWHNEPMSRFFHHQLAPYVSLVADERVRPTYAYVSAYQGGAVLARHLDREQCAYTMSLAIDEAPEGADLSWPLYFDTPAGTVSLAQSLGDAVLFRGSELPHYRHRLPDGHAATALLFHFVSDDFIGTHY